MPRSALGAHPVSYSMDNWSYFPGSKDAWSWRRPIISTYYCRGGSFYRGADKSLARPGRKQANVSVRMPWISSGALPCGGWGTWWQLASRCCWNRARPWHASELVSLLVGLRTYQHPGTIYRVLPSIVSLSNEIRCSIFPRREDLQRLVAFG